MINSDKVTQNITFYREYYTKHKMTLCQTEPVINQYTSYHSIENP